MKDSKMMPKSMLSFGLLAMAAASPAWSATIYVNSTATGANNGSSWTNAYTKLQNALTAASSPDEIQVAAGTYYPDEGTGQTNDSPASTFTMKAGVTLKGGYPTGGGTRAVAKCSGGDYPNLPCVSNSDCPNGGTCSGNKTYLSGDLAQDDATCSSGECCLGGKCVDADNATHVVTYDLDNVSQTATLDGFIVERGFADGDCSTKPQGAAVHIRKGTDKCLDGGPTLKDCVFRHHLSRHHGAVNDHGSATLIQNCLFSSNRVTCSNAEGGALNMHAGSTTVEDSVFVGNGAIGDGGAIWTGCDTDATCSAATCATSIQGCTFVGNSASLGGAIWSAATDAVIDSCTFETNSAAGDGGAIWLGSEATIHNSVFDYNQATLGTAIFVNEAILYVNGSEFLNNTSTATSLDLGGTIWNEGGDVELARSLFHDNYANAGAVIYDDNAATLTATDCDFFDNHGYAGGVLYDKISVSSFERCTFSRNTGSLGTVFYFDGGNASTMVSCTINDNGGPGAAILLVSSDVTLINSLIAANAKGGIEGGGDLVITNSTIAYNGYRGISSAGGYDITIQNSIFWGNTDTDGATSDCLEQVYCGQTSSCATCNGGSLNVTHSDIEGGTAFSGSNGNIASDPVFMDHDGADNTLYTGDENYRLNVTSTPCDDVGDNAYAMGCADLDGYARISGPGLNPVVDMGAYEIGPIRNNRYISFAAGNSGGVKVAVRVKMTKSFDADFTSHEGQQWWAQTPFDVTNGGVTYKIARLGCSPVFLHWNTYGTVYIADEEIIPQVVYHVEGVKLNTGICSSSSYVHGVVEPTVCAWGDVVGEWTGSAWTAPNCTTDENDIDAVVDRFAGYSYGPILPRADLTASVPNNIVDFSDIADVVDAAAGEAYPYSGPQACTCSGACEEFPQGCSANCCVYGRCCSGSTCTNTVQSDCSGTWTSGVMCETAACGMEEM